MARVTTFGGVELHSTIRAEIVFRFYTETETVACHLTERRIPGPFLAISIFDATVRG